MDKLSESIISEQIEIKGIEELARNVENPDETAKLIKDMDNMIKIKKNNILMIAYQQGKFFRRFKTDNKFISAVSAFEINKTTINFKIDGLDWAGEMDFKEGWGGGGGRGWHGTPKSTVGYHGWPTRKIFEF